MFSIRLFFLFFVFIFSSSSFSAWKSHTGTRGTSYWYESCEESFFRHHSSREEYRSPNYYVDIYNCVISKYNSDGTPYTAYIQADVYVFDSPACDSGSYPVYPSNECPPSPSCNSDQILNPETNTCDARCTEPDIWDPVTEQCITPKNRCDILGERKPNVEVDWKQSALGSSFVGQYSCMPSGCIVTGTSDVGCLSDNDRCYGDAVYTGKLCNYQPGTTSGWCSNEDCIDSDEETPNPDEPDYNPDPTPGDDFTPPNPDVSPDADNPNLNEEGNKGVVNELNTANKTLENIQTVLETTLKENVAQNKEVDKYSQKMILGIQNLTTAVNSINIPSGGGGSGGGDGGGSGDDSSVSGGSCDDFSCKGDAVVCYIAKKQWEESCGVEKAKRDDIPKLTDAFNKITTENPIEDLDAGSLDISTVMNKYTDGAGLTLSKTCPPPDVINTAIGSFTLDYSPFCDLARVIHFFLVSLALVGSAMLISKYGF